MSPLRAPQQVIFTPKLLTMPLTELMDYTEKDNPSLCHIMRFTL